MRQVREHQAAQDRCDLQRLRASQGAANTQQSLEARLECEVERRKQIAAGSREKDVQLAQRTAELARSKGDCSKEAARPADSRCCGESKCACSECIACSVYRTEAKAQRYERAAETAAQRIC